MLDGKPLRSFEFRGESYAIEGSQSKVHGGLLALHDVEGSLVTEIDSEESGGRGF